MPRSTNLRNIFGIKAGNDKREEIAAEFVELLVKAATELFGPARIGDVLGKGDPKDSIPFIIEDLSKEKGVAFTEGELDRICTALEKKYPPAAVGQAVIPLLPGGFLEDRRLRYLSKEELEAWVFERTKELKKLNEELEEKVRQRTEDLQVLLESQHKAGKLLVRRDLELSRANEKLRELDQRKSEFLSIVAHQLRTPLSGIKWTLSMIIKGELGSLSDDQKVFLMKSYESNGRMINLVEDMLQADRIDSGKFSLNLVGTQVLDLVDNVLYDILPNALKRNVQIVFNRGLETLPQARIDQEKMRAVFQNLLDNAVKYSHEGGTVSITASHDGEVLTFAIKDSGIGIPADQQGQVFSRFFRARNALKVETDGTGLGLFIVKSIIERHNGKIWFETKEGEGTTFYFTIKI